MVMNKECVVPFPPAWSLSWCLPAWVLKAWSKEEWTAVEACRPALTGCEIPHEVLFPVPHGKGQMPPVVAHKRQSFTIDTRLET